MTPREQSEALAVMGDLVAQLAQSGCPIDITVTAVVRAYELADPAVFDDVPPEGMSEGPSARIVKAFAARGMLLPQAPERKHPANGDEILRAIPARWVSSRTIARRLGFRSEQAAKITPDTRRLRGEHPDDIYLPIFVDALNAIVDFAPNKVQRQVTDHNARRGVVRYRRRE